jgi:hypothetical protein
VWAGALSWCKIHHFRLTFLRSLFSTSK